MPLKTIPRRKKALCDSLNKVMEETREKIYKAGDCFSAVEKDIQRNNKKPQR